MFEATSNDKMVNIFTAFEIAIQEEMQAMRNITVVNPDPLLLP